MQDKKETAKAWTASIFLIMILLGFLGVNPFFTIGMILVAAVVCTGGLGLIVVVPVLIVAYTIIYYTILFVVGRMTSNEIKKDVLVNQSSANELAIIQYIVDSRKTGIMRDEAIRSNLKNQGGWNDAIIDSAFKKCT